MPNVNRGGEGPKPFCGARNAGLSAAATAPACGCSSTFTASRRGRGGSDGPTPLIVNNYFLGGGDGPNPLQPYGCGCGPGSNPAQYYPNPGPYGGGTDGHGPLVRLGENLPENKYLLATPPVTGWCKPSKLVVQVPNTHRLYVRTGRVIDSTLRRCFVSQHEDCPSNPGGIDPFTWLDSWMNPPPCDWISCGLRKNTCCYYFDSASWLSNGWNLDPQAYYEKREINGGYYYYFGFIGYGPEPTIMPPGSFGVEAVAIYYWSDGEVKLEEDPTPYFAIDASPANPNQD